MTKKLPLKTFTRLVKLLTFPLKLGNVKMVQSNNLFGTAFAKSKKRFFQSKKVNTFGK